MVDQHCIVQTGDEAIKQEQLRHMHTVYANAEVTLVAVTSTGASAGLPGAPSYPARLSKATNLCASLQTQHTTSA